ncbi:MAG: 30S ribosomal protein S6 [Clostridia bacterium]|nr:30S ribosomal protein S6 [Clostridia bacterium]
MDKYEVLYIIRADVDDEAKAKVVEKFESIVAENGGTVDELDKWGMKKFAYEINKQTEGYYVLMNISCSKEAQAELDRLMRNDEAIIRQMIIKK